MRKFTITLFSKFSVLAAVVCCCLPVFAQGKVSIQIAPEITVENDTIRLGKIAEIKGDEAKAERMKNISLGYAPNVGMLREISRRQLELAISAAGFLPNEITIISPDKFIVRRDAQEISATLIRETIEKAISAQFSDNKILIQIVKIEVPEKIYVPLGKSEIRTNFANIRNPFAPFSLPLEIRIDGLVVRRISANLQIEGFAEILVAAKNLSLNSKITENDVRLEKRRIEKNISNYLFDKEKLRGANLVKNLTEGAEITADSFVAGVVVKNGDLLRIEGYSGKLKIIVSGEARASGKIGDRIAVKNSQSGAILQATVVDEGLVRINF